MKLGKLSKLALPAVLLTAGALAYADGEVSLTNGTKISWENFVASVKSKTPVGVEGIKGTVPDTDPAAIALKDANKKVAAAEDAKNTQTTGLQTQIDNTEASIKVDTNNPENSGSLVKAVSTAQEELDKANTTLEEKEKAVTTANTNLKNYIDGLETTYDDYVTSRDNKQKEFTQLQDDRKQMLSDSLSLAGQITTATSSLRNLKAQLAGLPKKKGMVTWMSNIVKVANTFRDNYEVVGTKVPVIYYSYIKGRNGTSLYISFASTVPTWTNDGKLTWQTINPDDFYTTIVEPTTGDFATIPYVYIYFGQQYADLNDGIYTSTININTTQQNYKAGLVGTIVSTVLTISKETTYQSYTDQYEDQSAANTLEGQIAEVEDEIAGYNKQLYGVHKGSDDKLPEGETEEVDGVIDNLKSNLSQMSTLLSDINTLNDETIPNAKKKWQDAANGTLKEDEEYTKLTTAITTAKGNVTTAKSTVDTKQAALDKANEALTTAQNDLVNLKQQLEDLTTNYNNAVAEQTTAQSNFNVAQAAADQAAAATYYTDNYNEITLNSDVNAAAATGVNYGGTIYAEGNLINISSTVTLFNTFSGKVNNAAINGTLAKDASDGKFVDVAVWTGANGRFYDDEGTRSNYTSLASLGFAARDYFGISFDDDQLAKLAPTSKVYEFTVYKLNSSAKQFVLIQGDGNYITGKDTKLEALTNIFAKSTTDDISKLDLTLTNVYYGVNNTCENVVLTDKVNFYCPENIQATKVTYNRELAAGYNAVCLPFAVNSSMFENNTVVDAICTYDREDTKKFWFTKITGDIPANTPALIHTTEATSFTLTGDLEFKQTPETQLVKGGTFSNDQFSSQSHGTFKYVNAGEFLGASQGEKIYGLRGDVFQLAVSTGQEASQAHFNAFRMAISSVLTPSSPGVGAPEFNPGIRGIGIQDENGNDITEDIVLGVKNVSNEVYTPGVIGGQGEIIINSDADFGDVQIFTMDGKMVAIAKVNAGTTTVNVEKGLYIVMGKKVMVK